MRTFTGRVISKKMLKTATVVVERVVAHPLYGRKFKRLKKYHVHDEIGARVGDTVLFAPSRPYSRLKRWRVVKLVDKNRQEDKSKGVESKRGGSKR